LNNAKLLLLPKNLQETISYCYITERRVSRLCYSVNSPRYWILFGLCFLELCGCIACQLWWSFCHKVSATGYTISFGCLDQ